MIRSRCLKLFVFAGVLLLIAACKTLHPRQTEVHRREEPRIGQRQEQQQVDVLQEPVQEEPEVVVPTVDTHGNNPLEMPGKRETGYKNPFPEGTYEHFAAAKAYPKTSEVYTDERLLRQITPTNSKIIICLPQQRARLYVYERVAMDWPVSTGTDGHETPTGVFRVMEKERYHHSGRYGKWVNGDGKVIDTNADLTKGHPRGATFRASSMPCWHRLTWDGVGIHGGRVVPGRRLSHGCIRAPYDVARKLYEVSELGMPVYVSSAVEDYNRGGQVNPGDVKYRPGGDHGDVAPQVPQSKSEERKVEKMGRDAHTVPKLCAGSPLVLHAQSE